MTLSLPNDLLARIKARRLWAYFHKDWLLQIRGMVREQLPRSYAVLVESETILVSPSGEDRERGSSQRGEERKPVLPDLGVVRQAPEPKGPGSGKATAAVLEVEEDCEILVQYALVVRRAPENRLVAACEILSPTNKGAFGPLEKEKHLRKRALYFASGVNLLEVDALLEGERLLPPSLAGLGSYARHAWTALHRQGTRRLRGWGWNEGDLLPVVIWDIEEGTEILVDLASAFEQACQFNDWAALAGK